MEHALLNVLALMTSQTASSSPRLGPPTVLVVDDTDDNRLLYATTIAEAGYAVEEASNGAEALAKVGARRPDVVVMDLSMPNIDGWEATRRIKADPSTAGIVVVALTAHASRFGLEDASIAGAEAVLTKPCLPEHLLGVIEALLPVAPPVTSAKPPNAPLHPGAAKKRLLVIEDAPDGSASYARTLRHEGFDVATAATVEEALDGGSRLAPDLVVLDCSLSDGSGLELLQRWRRSRDVRQIPVVIVTAHAGRGELATAAACGASGIVMKPCSGEALAAYIARVLLASASARADASKRPNEPLALVLPTSDALPSFEASEQSALRARCNSCRGASPGLGAQADDALKRLLALGWSSQSEWFCPSCVDQHRCGGRHGDVAG
jgi:CheY-like chemotaxis protein